MNTKLRELSENIAKANDLFIAKHPTIGTTIGIMDKVLRKQGMASDAVTIECLSSNIKIVFLLHDAKPNSVEVAFGNKAGDINSSSDHACELLSDMFILNLLEQSYVQKHN